MLSEKRNHPGPSQGLCAGLLQELEGRFGVPVGHCSTYGYLAARCCREFARRDAGDLLQDANWIPSGADLIKLEKYNCGASRLLLGPSVGQTPSGRRLHPLRSRHGGGGAYLLSRKGAERVLAERGRIAMPVDHFLFNANLSEMPRILRPIIVCPGMATQYAVPYSSDTWTRGRPTRPSRWRRIWPSLRRLANELRLIPLQTAEMLFCGARLRQVAFREDPPA